MQRGKRGPTVIVQFDGAIGMGNRASGLGVVVRDPQGRVKQVWSKRCRAITCNEAEYEALIYALDLLRPHRPAKVYFFSDSEIVVNQMRGHFAVRSPALKPLHRKACALAQQIPDVTYTHIPREMNGLADALAREALWPDTPWPQGEE